MLVRYILHDSTHLYICDVVVQAPSLYVYDGTATAWTLSATLYPDPAIPNSIFSNFGDQVATYGNEIIITGDTYYEGLTEGGTYK